MKIYKYDVRILKSNKYPNTFEVSEYGIAIENDKYIVLDNGIFTRITKAGVDGSDSDSTLGKHRVSNWTMGFAILDGIHYTQYSSIKVPTSTIKRRIRNFAKKEFGFIMDLDLEFIK